jgi:hypothetical protein
VSLESGTDSSNPLPSAIESNRETSSREVVYGYSRGSSYCRGSQRSSRVVCHSLKLRGGVVKMARKKSQQHAMGFFLRAKEYLSAADELLSSSKMVGIAITFGKPTSRK